VLCLGIFVLENCGRTRARLQAVNYSAVAASASNLGFELTVADRLTVLVNVAKNFFNFPSIAIEVQDLIP
jgi:hypothetical protein